MQKLKTLKNWCVWRRVDRGGKVTKVPFQVNGKPAKSNNPATWTTFEIVSAALELGDFDGVGFFLQEELGLVGIDLDHCVCDGQLNEFAQEVLDVLGETYVEVSPSGTGIRAFLRGEKTGDRCRNPKLGAEIYCKSRFLTVTGNTLTSAPIREDQEAIDQVYNLFFPVQEETPTPPPTDTELADSEILSLLANEHEDKWSCLWSARNLGGLYPPPGEGAFDWSSADAAMCAKIAFYTDDPGQIERIWGQSALAAREKFQRKDYRQRTISYALAHKTARFEGRSECRPERHHEQAEQPPEQAEYRQEQHEQFPLWVLPEVFREHVLAVSESICAPVDFAAHTTIISAAAMCGNSKIKIKESWLDSPNLYGAIVADTGQGKTPAEQAILRPSVLALEELLAEKNKVERADYRTEQVRYQKALSAWKKQRNDSPPPKEPEEFKPQEVYAQDATTESLAVSLSNNPKGILLYRDEITAWVKSLNQYRDGGKGGDREFFMECYSVGQAKVSRKHKEPIVVNAPRLCVFGGVVPKNLRTLIDDQLDGFAERLLLVYPRPIERKLSRAIVPESLQEKIKERYMELRKDETLEVDEEAFDLFNTWYDERFRVAGDHGFTPKLVQSTGRLALVLAKLHRKEIVDREIMEMAIALARYYLFHREKVESEASTSQEVKVTHSILAWSKKKNKETVALRELVRAGVPGCTSAKAARECCQELVDLEIAVWTDAGKKTISVSAQRRDCFLARN